MRARNIKPGFFMNDDMAELSFEARLLFIGLWLVADRDGYLEYRPKRIKAEVLPYDSSNVEKLLEELGAARFIQFYNKMLPNGNTELAFVFIPTFAKHQNPHRNEKPSEISPLIGTPEITGAVQEMHDTNPAERGMMKEERGKMKGGETEVSSRVLDYLNEKTKKSFKNVDSNTSLITARISEGFKEADFIRAIDNQVAAWSGDSKMEAFLRPATLFQKSKFDGYVNNRPTGESEWA